MTIANLSAGSTTLKSAQSKKCNLLKLVRNDATKLKLALIKLNADALLKSILSADDLRAAAAGLTNTNSKNRTIIKIDLNDYDDDGELIIKK